ncbi:MAG: TIGR03862 family flavoprotein [Pseudomonadota bacterium]
MIAQNPISIIGSGPSGLMAADVLSAHGFSVNIYDAMPSFGRKFLMAGKSGLNISHSEAEAQFLARYTPHKPLSDYVAAFDAPKVVAWINGLGIEEFIGTSGRIFPTMMKASPLLRALLKRLQDRGATFYTRHRWTGWTPEGALQFETPKGLREIKSDAALLALGGASWRRLGSDGEWAALFALNGIETAPFQASNCGFTVDWTQHLIDKWEGTPVKSIELSVEGASQTTRSEFVITRNGVESGGIYTLSAALRHQFGQTGAAALRIDLLPDVSRADVKDRLRRPRGKATLSSYLRKTLNLGGVKLALLYELTDQATRQDQNSLIKALKYLRLPLTGIAPLDEAISTVGGVPWQSLDEHLMLKQRPGVFCAGEMIDWDAPTGGYLITGCLATGVAAANGIVSWRSAQRPA